MQRVDTSRHTQVFNSAKFIESNQRVDIIGCGATGSRIATELARLGISSTVSLYDGDSVEPHNVANQVFRIKQIGLQKAVSTSIEMFEISGEQPRGLYPIMVTPESKYNAATHVFLLTDTMQSRKDIFNTFLKNNPNVANVIETRMGTDSGRVYCFDPCSSIMSGRWELTLCTDEQAEVSACGTRITVGQTAAILANLAVWQFIKFVRFQDDSASNAAPEFQVIFGTRPCMMVSIK